MITVPEPPYLSPDEYLQQEARSPLKHEYINGEVVAMAGASDVQVTIAGNIFALLRAHLRGSGCRVYISDMKVRVAEGNCFFYPDVFVTCDARDQTTTTYKSFPCLIIEVLSESTEAFDRGDKFIFYQNLQSLQEYVLMNTHQQQVKVFRRKPEGRWVLQSYTPEQPHVQFTSINWQGALANLYEDAVLGVQPVPQPDN